MPHNERTPLEATRLDPYLMFLFLLLSTATLFDGFDSAMFSFAAPDVRDSLGIDREQWGILAGFTRTGVMLSFVFMLFADRYGRRLIMMITILGFSLANGLTAFARDATEFAILQLIARLFLTAEYALAVIMVSEEFPTRSRGRAIAILTSLATVGVMAMSKLQPYVLLPEGAPETAIHAFGISIVVWGQDFLGLAPDPASWRALYVLGVFPLGLILVLRLAMRETRRFSAIAAERVGQKSEPLRERIRTQWEAAIRPWSPRYRRRSAIVALLWNSVYIVTGPSTIYWVIFAREDLGLSTTTVGSIVFWGYGGGVAGHFVAGALIDRIGRKWTCSSFYILAAVSIYLLYHVPTVTGQYIWMISTVFCFGAAITATHVYASELFPTEIRATGYGWTTNFVGRITEVVTPITIGLMLGPLGGIPEAITVVAAGPIIGALLVLAYAPETMGMTLEEVESSLDEAPVALAGTAE